MKRILSLVFSLLFCLVLFPVPGSASGRDLELEASLAASLKELGLFQGVGEDEEGNVHFDLNRKPSRVEALTMLVRALGKGPEAETYGKTHPFQDVPSWADGYVSYAYDHELTKGVSDTRFGAEDVASAEMYLTFMLRALGYTEYTKAVDGDFTWDAPWALAAWCEIVPPQVDGKNFLRADVVDVTCAALYAPLAGEPAVLHEKLVSEKVFTQAQFDAAFPEEPFSSYHQMEQVLTDAIAARLPVGLLNENGLIQTRHRIGAASHLITELAQEDGVLTVSALVYHLQTSIAHDGVLDRSTGGSTAPWQFTLDANTMELLSCRTAGELRAEGKTLEECFSQKTLSLLETDTWRGALRIACNAQIQRGLDTGELAYKTLSYEETLAKVKASFPEVLALVETEYCTAMLGKGDEQRPYILYLVYKPESKAGEVDIKPIVSSTQGELSVSEDGNQIYYSFRYENRAYYEAFPPNSSSSIPQNGTCHYTFDFREGSTSIGFTAD